MSSEITREELADARKRWGDGLVAISKAYEEGGIEAATRVAREILDTAYDYGHGPVLFKPTLASGEQTFRPTHEGALSYFVGHNPKFPKDDGFGTRGWTSVSSKTSQYFIHGNIAMWMGHVTCVGSTEAGPITVDKSWGYRKDENGTLRIVLHHSSLPYEPKSA